VSWAPAPLELLWTSLAVIGIITSIYGIVVQAKDFRAARDFHNGLRTRRLIVTRMMLRNEIASVIVQFAFLLLGIMALFTQGGQDPNDFRRSFWSVILWSFVTAEIALVTSTLARRRDRHWLRRVVEAEV